VLFSFAALYSLARPACRKRKRAQVCAQMSLLRKMIASRDSDAEENLRVKINDSCADTLQLPIGGSEASGPDEESSDPVYVPPLPPDRAMQPIESDTSCTVCTMSCICCTRTAADDIHRSTTYHGLLVDLKSGDVRASSFFYCR
jgi:hypothetical protein